MTLAELKSNPMCKALLAEGFIYPKINTYIEMYLYYDSKIQSNVKKSLAITWTADMFNMSETTIYTVIKRVSALQQAIDTIQY